MTCVPSSHPQAVTVPAGGVPVAACWDVGCDWHTRSRFKARISVGNMLGFCVVSWFYLRKNLFGKVLERSLKLGKEWLAQEG